MTITALKNARKTCQAKRNDPLKAESEVEALYLRPFDFVPTQNVGTAPRVTQPVSIFEIGFIKNMRLFAFTLSIIPYILFSQPRSVHTYQPGIDVLN